MATAADIRTGDIVTYLGKTFKALGVSTTDAPGSLVRVATSGLPEYIADFREVEIERPDGPRYTFQKDQYFRPCESYTCAVSCKARGLHNIRYEQGLYEWVEYPSGKQERVWATTGHEVEIVQWVVIDREDPDHMVEAFDTRREARAYAARLEARR